MNKAQLLQAGYTEAQVENILKLHKEAIDGNYIPKHRFDEVNSELTTARTQLTERDTQIKELKKFEGASDALKDKITQLETENANTTKQLQAQLSAERKKTAVKLALLADETVRPHDPEMVMGLFNLEQIVVDDSGKITSGFKEQHDGIKKEKAFLFKEETSSNPNNPGSGWKPAGNPPPDGNKGGRTDPAESFGKTLAQSKLAQLGIKPTAETKTN